MLSTGVLFTLDAMLCWGVWTVLGESLAVQDLAGIGFAVLAIVLLAT